MSISPQELINAIKAVHNGGIYIDRELIFTALRDYTSNSKKDEIFLDPLTHKEEEVLELLRKGLSNREIAKLLGISEKTVKSHLTDIFSKLNVKSRLEAVIVTNELLRKSDINLRPKSY
jgi:DNA-binding NarL/FixJ family response regulator